MSDIQEQCKRDGMKLTPAEIETMQEFTARDGEQNGKGDSPRNNTSNKFRENYDKIFKKKKSNVEKNIRKKTKG
jgi:hypothetical protein